ncbi:MAG: zinc ribbon domain-containing protein [Deltaproteobacteria bacterium]|nr:zinc ribbon domain-containing protein [Deltaproteobacteria bacterium]
MQCQSCGMLIMKGEEFGTFPGGVKNLDYCYYCFNKGAFTQPDITLEQMAEKLAGPMKLNKNMSDEEAKQGAMGLISGLKRWKTKN